MSRGSSLRGARSPSHRRRHAMQPLSLPNPPAAFLRPDRPLAFIVVGCGGTGSYVAQGLARLMYDQRQRNGLRLLLMLVDGDVVEAGNCGRQLFAPSEIGLNKAQALCARLTAVWGLPITAVPEMADTALLHELSRGAPEFAKVLLGCVDTTLARRHLAAAHAHYTLTLDCGNADQSGQVAVGTTMVKEHLRGALRCGSIAAHLPSPYMVYPNLIETAAPMPHGDASCAAAVAAQRQGLNVNQIVADIAVQYLTTFVEERRLTTFRTHVDIQALSMRSWPITPTALAEATGLDAAWFVRDE
ncbi:MAG: hypothetical protein EI684_19305 [Candidatus Viridilinea halotolerans]|uniref:THIF-type NAD/FAD binding fold domain-containing protein n=1 Tax=Candidatus Viridilinea halotolerans TaxID=2491704 RepID=A0A426TSU2_9CHLR|nr:MAG: hypothetical protein EI684_19305 [Candidatus Viridilinea halotolerans]